MPATFTCRMVDDTGGLRKFHLVYHGEQQSDGYFNVTPDVLAKMCHQKPKMGDEIAVQLIVVGRVGSNGQHKR